MWAGPDRLEEMGSGASGACSVGCGGLVVQ